MAAEGCREGEGNKDPLVLGFGEGSALVGCGLLDGELDEGIEELFAVEGVVVGDRECSSRRLRSVYK